MGEIRQFLRLAGEAKVVRRALCYAVVVGSILIMINHGDAILAGDLTPTRWWKMGLTTLVPYLVSTLSSVSATRQAMQRPPGRCGRPGSGAGAR